MGQNKTIKIRENERADRLFIFKRQKKKVKRIDQVIKFYSFNK